MVIWPVKKRAFVMVVLIFVICLTSCTIEKKPEANSVRIASVMGEVSFQRPETPHEWIKAVSGMQLGLNNTLTTADSSETDLDVDQDQHVLVGENVRMIIESLLSTIEESKVARLRVDTGAVYIRIQRKLSSEESFEVITPTCIMGVRGTEFVVSVLGSDTQLFVLDGTVAISLKTHSETVINVEKGQMISLPWELTSIEESNVVPIDFFQMPMDMLDALSQYTQPEYKELIPEPVVGNENPIDYVSEKPYVMPMTGHVYARIDLDRDYSQAVAYCNERGGHLITITSEQEQKFAEKIIAQGEKFWYLIGLEQKPGATEPNQGFEWINGEALEYTNWHMENGRETEPSDMSARGNHENQVLMLNSADDPVWKFGEWNDVNLTEMYGNYGFICEWESVQDILRVDNTPDVIPEALTYNRFKSFTLGSSITVVQQQLGKGHKTLETSNAEERVRWMFKDGDKYIFCLTQVNGQGQDVIYFIGHENLLSEEEAKSIGFTSLSIENNSIMATLNGMKSLDEAVQYLGTEGVLTSRMLQDGEAYEFYLWRDASGYGYQLALNTTTNEVSNSFKNPK